MHFFERLFGTSRDEYVKLNYFRHEAFARPRWGHGRPPNRHLYEIIDQRRDAYSDLLKEFLVFKEGYLNIPFSEDAAPLATEGGEPFIDNPWLPPLDSFSLYSLFGWFKPSKYVEVGSGNSTRFARRAIKDFGLDTTITSIDPEPRAEVDALCDEVVRSPVEDLDPAFFDSLGAGDILFVDNSHRVFMNSDVTAVFLDILPRLAIGVIVHIHDILLPSDYPPKWGRKYYSEQYLLGAYLLGQHSGQVSAQGGEGGGMEILLPCAFIDNDPELRAILDPLFTDERWCIEERYGVSFWMRVG